MTDDTDESLDVFEIARSTYGPLPWIDKAEESTNELRARAMRLTGPADIDGTQPIEMLQSFADRMLRPTLEALFDEIGRLNLGHHMLEDQVGALKGRVAELENRRQ